ncbi:DUF2909 family protein [Algibacillus agarilyticus]|uniref:DUF2909 family protein n=1 Tax=Algibacillus agarilyticus TaxID=2234133 RepID=UPI000DD04278|nr:DUF2909 family protein [Algibacillus agarilyticus]
MIIKILIVILFLLVVFSLFKALFIMLKDDKAVSMSQVLGKRLISSITILAIILIFASLGVIQLNPTPI